MKHKVAENMNKSKGEPIKTCSCGMKLTTANSTFVGEQDVHGIPAFKGKRMMLYNCPKCESTVTHLESDETKKSDRLEVTADGKQEFDVGSEPLDKLKDRWKKLKKALDSDKSIMSVTGQEYNPDDDKEQESDQQNQESDQQEQQPDQQEQQPDDQNQSPDQDQGQESDQSDDQQEQQPDQQEQQQDEDSKMSDDQIEEALRNEGYSDTEIAHIVHGHILPEATVDDHKAKNEMIEGQIDQQNMVEDSKMERDHKKRMQDLEHKKAESEMVDPEIESNHRKRTLDLEHETQKKKAAKEDLELDHRKRLQELEIVAKQKEFDKVDPSEDNKKRQADMELEHKKRMMDLEHAAKKKEVEKEDPTDNIKLMQAEFELHMKKLEGELELKYKEKELQLNLRLKEEAAKLKSQMQEEQMKQDHVVNTKIKSEQAKHKLAESKKPPTKDKVAK